jgi:hypothetical protein
MRRADDGVIRIVDEDAVIRVVSDDDDELRDGETLHVRMSMMDSARPVFDVSMHQPGFRCDNDAYLRAYRRYCRDAGLPSHRVSDAAVRDARSAWIADMTAAWKTDARKRKRLPDPDELPDPGDDDDEPGEPLGSEGQYLRQFRSRRKIGQTALPFESHADARSVARDEYVRKLCDAWRTPVGDAAQPDLGSRPEDPRAPSGVTDPDRAASIEERAERARGRIWDDYRKRLENAWRSPGHAPQSAHVGPGPASTIAGVASPDPVVRTRPVSSGPGPAGSGR